MIDKTKFTPGPWVAIPSKIRSSSRLDEKPIFDDGIWHILPESNTWRLPICTVDKGDDHDEPTRIHAEIDARLIAAAPELYAALVDLREEVRCLRLCDTERNELADLGMSCDKADAAIAKARGEA